MDLTKPIAELRKQRERILAAIRALERLEHLYGNQNNHRPKWPTVTQVEDDAERMGGPDGRAH